ncbi:MAG: hypothetical protein B6I18_04130 [Bacteroidetes bacterium 4572_112]|nr:MAG: hypothetical protein B6I18_04130 [Bacteroidetes bacterium 4572_112]
MLISTGLFAQQNTKKQSPKYLWAVNANFGYSILWGDAASQNPNPFARWFDSNESAFSYGLNIHRKLNNTFKLQGGILVGNLNSYRENDSWSDDTHPQTSANTSYFDGHIAVNVDFTSIMGFKPDRLVSFYGLVGVGMAQYSATSYLDGIEQIDRTVNGASTLIIPWGWGLDFRINDHFSITFENTFRHTFVDDFDAYIGADGNTLKDFYSVTGLGLTYKFGEKREKKKPKIEIEPVEPSEDSTVAVAIVEKIPAEIVYRTNVPDSVSPNTEYNVNSIVNKGDTKGEGVYKMSIPEDFYVSNVIADGGKIEQDSSSLTVSWTNVPEGNLMVSYKLSVGGLEKDNYTITSNYIYNEDSIQKEQSFTDVVYLKSVIVKSEIADNQKQDFTTEQAPVASNIEYRVQVATAFGGTVSKGLLKKRLGLSQDVKEDPYKNSYRYTVGSYETYSDAAQNSALSKVKGAYVVVFVDGKYVGGLGKVNKDVMDQDGIYKEGTTYKIQIAGSKGRSYPISRLAYKYGLKENEITEDESAGWFLYSFGKYRNAEDAKPSLKQIKAKVPKAYIIKFTDGKRIRTTK